MSTTTTEVDAVSCDAMRAVLALHPDLCASGMRVRRGPGGDAEFQSSRDHLLDPVSVAQFSRARQWWRLWPKAKGINIKGTTRSLLTIAVHTIGECSPGAFIAAGIAEHFIIERDIGTPHVWTNISGQAWR
jgi:hypothetical protein